MSRVEETEAEGKELPDSILLADMLAAPAATVALNTWDVEAMRLADMLLVEATVALNTLAVEATRLAEIVWLPLG